MLAAFWPPSPPLLPSITKRRLSKLPRNNRTDITTGPHIGLLNNDACSHDGTFSESRCYRYSPITPLIITWFSLLCCYNVLFVGFTTADLAPLNRIFYNTVHSPPVLSPQLLPVRERKADCRNMYRTSAPSPPPHPPRHNWSTTPPTPSPRPTPLRPLGYKGEGGRWGGEWGGRVTDVWSPYQGDEICMVHVTDDVINLRGGGIFAHVIVWHGLVLVQVRRWVDD